MSEYVEVGELGDDVLLCKHYRTHAWTGSPTVDISGLPTVQYATWVITSVCTRCGRERIVYLDRLGRRIGKPLLRWPADYPRTHRLDGDAVGGELVKRGLLVQRFRNGKR